MELTVKNKRLDTQPISRRLTQGEALVDRPRIVLPKTYEGLDISGYSYEIRATSDKDTMVRADLEKTVEGDDLVLLWTITAPFTAVSGPLSLTIVGTDENGEEIIKITSDKIIIREDPDGSYTAPPPDLLNDALRQMSIMQAAANTAKDAAEDAQEAAEASQTAAGQSAQQAAISAAGAAQSASAAATKAEEASASAASSAASEDRARQYAEQAASVTTGYKGYYTTPASLRAAYPTGENGWFAIVGRVGDDTRNTIWSWDDDENDWADTNNTIDLAEFPSWADLTGALLMPCNCIYESGTHVITHQSVKQIPGTRYTIVMVPTHDYTAGDAVTVAGTAVEVHYGMSNVDVQTGAWQAGKPVQVEVNGNKLYIQGGPPALDAPRRYGSKPITSTSYEGNTTVTGTPSPDNPATLTPVEPPAAPGAAQQIGPLWSLPDGTKDTYDGATGLLVRRVGKLVLDGTENWRTYNEYILIDIYDTVPYSYCICSHFMPIKATAPNQVIGNKECVINEHEKFAVKYDNKTVDEFKSWLAAQAAAGTPVTVLYELAEPIVERIIETSPISTRATDILSPSWEGKTTVTGTPSPDNPAAITGVPFAATATGPNGESRSVDLDFTGYSLPDGTKDTFDGVRGDFVQRVEKLVLDGTEDWLITSGKPEFYTPISPKSNAPKNLVSSHFNVGDTTTEANAVQLSRRENILGYDICINWNNTTDIGAFKSWLTAQAAAGTPVTVLYELAEPIASYRKADITAFDGQTIVTGADTVEVIEGRVLRVGDIAPWETKPFANAGAHNSIYRGMYLGDHVTATQYDAIAAGTFDDLYIGDYWTIGGVNYRIAAFDYFINCGDTPCTTHHMIVVPDTQLYTHVMNNTSTTEGGYYSSKMRTSGLNQAKTTAAAAFGATHILTHREFLTNAVANGRPSGASWYDCTVELMNEMMVYGSGIFQAVSDGTTVPYKYTVSKGQLPLFMFRHDLIGNRENWWLKDIITAATFATVNGTGNAGYASASNALGVRPAFCIYGGEQ